MPLKAKGRYQQVETLELEPMEPVTIFLEGVEFPLLLIKQVFANEDGSTGILYLAMGSPLSVKNDGMSNPIISL